MDPFDIDTISGALAKASIDPAHWPEALETGATFIASACPFCNTMMTDGVKNREKENEVAVLDVAEMIAASML